MNDMKIKCMKINKKGEIKLKSVPPKNEDMVNGEHMDLFILIKP